MSEYFLDISPKMMRQQFRDTRCVTAIVTEGKYSSTKTEFYSKDGRRKATDTKVTFSISSFYVSLKGGKWNNKIITSDVIYIFLSFIWVMIWVTKN